MPASRQLRMPRSASRYAPFAAAHAVVALFVAVDADADVGHADVGDPLRFLFVISVPFVEKVTRTPRDMA